MQLGKVFVYFVSNTISDYTPNIIEKSKANGNFYVHLHSQKMISWLAFVLLTQAGVIWGEGISTEKMSPSDWPINKSMKCFLN